MRLVGLVIAAASLAACGRGRPPRPAPPPPAAKPASAAAAPAPAAAPAGGAKATPAPAGAPAAAAGAPRAAAPAATPAPKPVAQKQKEPTQGAPNSVPITDAHVAGILAAANAADVSYARIASARSSNPRVRQYAEQMQRDHEGLNALAADLTGRLRVTPADHPIALDWRDLSEAVRDTLRELSGPAFDRYYAMNEVRYHANLLEAVEGLLVPAVQQPDLKALLTQAIPVVRAHLKLAVQLSDAVR